MSDDLKIRLATPDDVGAIQQCVNRAYEMYVPRMGKKPAPMLADYSALVDEGVATVIQIEPMIAGLIVMFPREHDWFVENIAVDPAFQGKGVGTKLMMFAESEAARHGRGRIELYTNQKMVENLDFYPKLGFERFDERVEDGYRRIYFRKHLGAG